MDPHARAETQRYDSGTPWEPIVGYSRAIRVGQMVFVSGTTATDAEGHIVGIGDVGAQMRQVLQNVQRALVAVGSSYEDVVRTRIYLVNIDDWQIVGAAHGEMFRAIRPATSMVEVKRLIAPEILVELEVDAMVR